MKSYLMVPFSWPILCVVQGQKHVSFVHTSYEFVVYSNRMQSFNIYLFLGGFVIALTSMKWFFTNINWYGKHSFIVKTCSNTIDFFLSTNSWQKPRSFISFSVGIRHWRDRSVFNVATAQIFFSCFKYLIDSGDEK